MDKKAIVEAARERLAESVRADQSNREHALDDLRMVSGDQWPDDIREERENAGKLCLTHNQLPQFTRQVTGEIRQLNPAIKIIPGDGDTDEQMADLFEGIIRGIEYASDASTVYEGAAESAANCGVGAFRVLTDYEDEMSFNQVIRIKPIHNPLSVYMDPASREPTREGQRYCFITEMVGEKEFKRLYPKASPMDVEHDGITDGLEHWQSAGSVMVAEYFWKEPTTITIGLTRDGTVIENPTAAHDVVRTRETVKSKVMWAKVSGHDVLEGPTEMPGKHIPVIVVTGEELHVGDEVKRSSVIRFAKDDQMGYNYASSTNTEIFSLQPKAPFLLTKEQIRGMEALWGEANSKNRPYLVYNTDPGVPPPQRQTPPVPSVALLDAMERAREGMQATTGIYNASLGQKSNETSGVAIRQRQMESDVSTSIYADNLRRAIAHCGRILVDLIPKIYDTERDLSVIGGDESTKLVKVNKPWFDPVTGESGYENDTTVGKYEVRVSVGPSYSTKRQEAAEGLAEFVRAVPQAGQVAGDLIAKNLDWPGADVLAERLAKMLPPGMVENDDPTPEEQQAMQQQQAMAEQQQQLAQMQQELQMRALAAETAQAEADAQKAGFEAQGEQFDTAEKQLELAAKSGQLDAVIAAHVEQAVARALMGRFPV